MQNHCAATALFNLMYLSVVTAVDTVFFPLQRRDYTLSLALSVLWNFTGWYCAHTQPHCPSITHHMHILFVHLEPH